MDAISTTTTTTTVVRPRLVTITSTRSNSVRSASISSPKSPQKFDSPMMQQTTFHPPCPSTPPPPPPVTSKALPPTPTSAVTHASQPSFASSSDDTYGTAATSVNDSFIENKPPQLRRAATEDLPSPMAFGPMCHFHQEPDEWYAQFHSDLDLSVANSDVCPDRATLAAVHDIPIYSADGAARPFGSLYDPKLATHQRQLILFVRHFYCGACQAYLKAVAEGIPRSDYFSIPVPTNIIVIGCGQPHLIPQYRKFAECPFPIFADPSRRLFKKLGMSKTLSIGKKRPDYMKDISPAAWIHGQSVTIRKSLKEEDGIRKRDIVRGGHPMQIGGEFLFDEGEVVWCHRMRNYRDHTEVSALRKMLELDED